MGAICYTSEKSFSADQAKKLFLSVGWISGRYPQRLYRALMGSSLVVTAWDGERLVGLIRALDDGELTAYVHYALVDPAYQGRGIAGQMIELVKDRYRDFLYIEVMPEESRNAAFYERFGFRRMEDGVAMQIVNRAYSAKLLPWFAHRTKHPRE